MRVALVQMNSRDEKAENLERAEMLIAQAAGVGVGSGGAAGALDVSRPARSATPRWRSRFPGDHGFLARLAGRYGFWLVGGSFLEAVEGQERVH